MLADRAPSAWLASQTIQRAASAVGSSVAERRGPGEVADRRLAGSAASSSMTSRLAVEVGAAGRLASRSAGEVATCGIAAGVSCRVSPLMVAPRRDVRRIEASPRRASTTIRNTMITIRVARNIPPRWSFLTVAGSSGGGGSRGVPGGGGVEVTRSGAARPLRWTVSAIHDRDQVQDDRRRPATAACRRCWSSHARDQEQDAGDRHGRSPAGRRASSPIACDLARAKFACCGSLPDHRPHDRARRTPGRTRGSRPDVQEQEERRNRTRSTRRLHRCGRLAPTGRGAERLRHALRAPLTKSTRTYSPRCSGSA